MDCLKNMKKIFYKNIYIIIATIILFLFSQQVAYASSVSLDSSKETVGIEEEFYLDVLLDTEGQSINGIEGTIIFDNQSFSLVRIEDGKSMVSFWVEKPSVIDDNQIKFSGIIPNGYEGMIDPFNTKQKLPGPVLRLVFKGLKEAEAKFYSLPGIVTLNDGEGTVQNFSPSNVNITIANYLNPLILQSNDDVNPVIEYQIIQDINLFNGKFVLVYHAFDKGTGIEKVLIKEGKRKWKEIESPYQLSDQSRRSPISLMAINFSGASIIKAIDPQPSLLVNHFYQLILIVIIVLIFIIILIVFYYFKKLRINFIKRKIAKSQENLNKN